LGGGDLAAPGGTIYFAAEFGSIYYGLGFAECTQPSCAAPRPIVPDSRYLITRRCALRQFGLRPGPTTHAHLNYLLAEAARRTGVKIVGYVAISNG
jgi:hypothetical protein